MTPKSVGALNDGNIQATLNALAERAGEVGARRAVKESFFLLGVDIGKQESVDAFRSGMRRMRDDAKSEGERKSQLRGSAIHGVITLLVSILASIGTIVVAAVFRVGPTVHP